MSLSKTLNFHLTHTLEKRLNKKCGERNAMVKSSDSSADEHASGRRAELMFAQAARQPGRHFIREKKRGDESETLLTLICSVLDRKVSKQSPGAGAFWWTKLPAWRLHVSQVNKTQRREGRKGEAGGSVRPEEGGDRCKPMVVFLQTSGDVWTESGSRYSPFVRFLGGNQVWNPGVSVSNMIYLLTFSFHSN